MHRREAQVQLWPSLDEKRPYRQREMISLWMWWVCTQETAALGTGGHGGYSYGIGRIKVETEAVHDLGGGRRSQKCCVGGAEEEHLTAVPQVREGSIQETPDPGL